MPDPIPRGPFDQGLFLTHLNKGRELVEARKYEEAERQLEEAYLLRPRDPRVRLNLLGLSYFRAGKLDKAAEVYRKLVIESPEAHTLHQNLGLISLKLARLVNRAGSGYTLLASASGLVQDTSAAFDVTAATTTTTITGHTAEPTVTGQAITVSWTVTVNLPGSGTPQTGTAGFGTRSVSGRSRVPSPAHRSMPTVSPTAPPGAPRGKGGAAMTPATRLRLFYLLYYGNVGTYLPYFAAYLRGRGFTGEQIGLVQMLPSLLAPAVAISCLGSGIENDGGDLTIHQVSITE